MSNYAHPSHAIVRLRELGFDESGSRQIVVKFAELLVADENFGEIRDTVRLPHPKQIILDALFEAYIRTDDKETREALIDSMSGLASYQNGVGREPLWRAGIDVSSLSPTASDAEILNFAARIKAGERNRERFKAMELKVDEDRQKLVEYSEKAKSLSQEYKNAKSNLLEGAQALFDIFKMQADDGATILVDASASGVVLSRLYNEKIIDKSAIRKLVNFRTASTVLFILGFLVLIFAPWYAAIAIILCSLIVSNRAYRHGAEALLRESLANPYVFAIAEYAGAFRLTHDSSGEKRARELPFHLNRNEISRGYAP